MFRVSLLLAPLLALLCACTNVGPDGKSSDPPKPAYDTGGSGGGGGGGGGGGY